MQKFLSERGHDVWVLELRGHGRSSKLWGKWLSSAFWPEGNQGATWSVVKYIEQDLPAAVDYVKSVTLAAKVHWVGHSMGGIILYSWLAFHMENSKDFASIVTLGSSLDHPREASPSQKLKLEAEQEKKAMAPNANMTSAYHFLYGQSIVFD